MIKLIVACNDEGVIGINNNLPFSLKSDMKRFKKLTQGNIVVMGRKTWESIGSKPLPNRRNIVLSRNKDLELPEGVDLIHDMSSIYSEERIEDRIFYIIGGATLYNESISSGIADEILITKVTGKITNIEETDIVTTINVDDIPNHYELCDISAVQYELKNEQLALYQFLKYKLK